MLHQINTQDLVYNQIFPNCLRNLNFPCSHTHTKKKKNSKEKKVIINFRNTHYRKEMKSYLWIIFT